MNKSPKLVLFQEITIPIIITWVLESLYYINNQHVK